ncbi:MAG: MATE family efflux transporter [Fibrobacter sp.]|jgi:MATE family multidrug resistance protein|nr:MATE family efflux transporter [Fibrobacter sp.]
MSTNEAAHSELLPPKQRGSMRELAMVALPMVLSMSFDTIMTFVDRFFLSRLGSEYMNAALAGGNSQMVLMTFFTGLMSYSTALVAQNLGAGKRDRCASVLTQTLILGVFSYPLILFLRPAAYLLFDISGIDSRQLAPQIAYFDILIYGSIITLFRHSLGCFFSGIGETRIVMVASFAGMFVNVILNYLLIFGNFGFPALGIEGAAIGTLAGGFAALLILVFRYLCRDIHERFQTKSLKNWHLRLDVIKTLVRKGSSSGMEMVLNMFAFQCMILLFHGQGLSVATAATIMFSWDMVAYVPLIGLEIAVMSLVGRYAGAKDRYSANRTTRSAIKLGWIFSVCALVAFVGFPGVLADVFKPDTPDLFFGEARPLAVFMIRLAAVYVMINTVMVVFAGALRGVGDTFWVMIAMATISWFSVFSLWLSLYVFDLGAKAGWCVLVGLTFLAPIVLFRRWHSGKSFVLFEKTETQPH